MYISRERKFLEHPLPRNGSSAGAKVLGLFTARERMFHGTNAPQERKSLCGLFAPWNESAEERKARYMYR